MSLATSDVTSSKRVAGAATPVSSCTSENIQFSSQPVCEGTMTNSRGAYARKFRGNSRNVLWSTRDVAYKLQDVARATYDGDQSKAKAFADDAASSPRAAENWLAGDNPMSLTAFLNAYHANPTFKAWARKILLMEEDLDPQFQAELAKFIQAAQRVQP